MRIIVNTTLGTANTFNHVENLKINHDTNGEIEAEFDFVMNWTGDKEKDQLQHCKLSRVRTLVVDMNN